MKYAFALVMIFTLLITGCNKNTENHDKKEDKNITKKYKSENRTKEPQQREKVLVSEAVTKLLDKSENRIENIKLASSAINGLKITPGESFSFNETVGERTEERGYKKAPIIIYEEREYDYGGGVCQMSTTLYQAAKKAGLEIEEHHTHKKEVNYSAKGEDSAVDYGVLDLKFKNNTESEIVIYTGVYEDCVIVQIYN